MSKYIDKLTVIKIKLQKSLTNIQCKLHNVIVVYMQILVHVVQYYIETVFLVSFKLKYWHRY